MYEHPEQERKSTFFLLSLLLHLLLFYICFLFLSYHKSSKTVANRADKAQKELSTPGSRQQPSPTPQEEIHGNKEKEPEKEEPKKEKEELAELKARQSAFGAPVVFAEMPESTPTVASNTVLDDESEQPETEPLSKTEEKAEQKQEVIVAKQEKPQEAPRELDPHAVSLQALQKIVESKAESKQEAQELLKETLAALENKERKVIRKPAPRAKTTTAYNEGNAQRSAGPTNKKFTFADLANGFMENIQSGGKDLINQRGNPNIRPGIEQLKQASYRQKMAWSLQAAFKRAARRTTFIQPVPNVSALELTFYITKDGELENLVVNSPTGHQELDAYIVKTVKDAFPLPPIPEHWKEEMLTQTWVFRNIRPDESSYMVNF